MSHEPGRFCWVGLATSDPAAAVAFYGTLFGWNAEERQAGGYSILRRDGEDVAILYRQTAEARAAQAPPHWTSFVSVRDADATAARARDLGGEAVFRKPFDVLDAGRVAAIRDPDGAILSLWEPRSKAGATLTNGIGALCWNELVTSDVERVKPFYRELLGWEYERNESDYTTIRSGGRPAGGIRKRSTVEANDPPHWRPFFMVGSVDAAIRTAEQAGAYTLLGPHGTEGARTAVVADPQGAAFVLIEGPIGRQPRKGDT